MERVPERGNALAPPQRDRRTACLDRASADPAVRSVVITGAHRLMTAVLDCDKPVLAAVNGTAAGIGVHLALCCDLVLAADDSAFVEIFARRGLVADGAGAYLLPRLTGPRRAEELMVFAEPLPAEGLRAFADRRAVAFTGR
jgi:2-(1,2-epoxy-1,2-dihydrophenyl)acetyl-CoA isomerase